MSIDDDHDNKDDNECGNEVLKDMEPKMRNAVCQACAVLNSAVISDEDENVLKMVIKMEQDDIAEIVKTDHVIKRYAGLRTASLQDEDV